MRTIVKSLGVGDYTTVLGTVLGTRRSHSSACVNLGDMILGPDFTPSPNPSYLLQLQRACAILGPCLQHTRFLARISQSRVSR
ncbi:hypothetical protein TIFTF001_045479 [Ficus carica]|uniref:Uncharacterized protein n=1 Tax=Ficus carica TaxID=3494 RepID=A0AA87YS04_FICCA|nr:hypothetical protein TIFTF001_045479 [Ficus carica]